jgi:hypothetical protein
MAANLKVRTQLSNPESGQEGLLLTVSTKKRLFLEMNSSWQEKDGAA